MGARGPGGAGGPTWRNWARTQSATPLRVARPRDLEALVQEVTTATAAGRRLRAVGSGHSFTGAAVTDGVQLHLDALTGVERVAPRPDGNAHVTVGAGTRLADLNAALAARGLAMRNLGDIDRQTVAGAISTGTHGTGARLGGLATQVVGCRVVTAAGDVVEVSPGHDPELFELARLGLGTAGVLAAVTLEVVPAFRLRAREAPMPLAELLTRMDELADANDHFELFWFPHTDRALAKCNNRVADDEADQPLPLLRHLVDDEVLSNGVFAVTNRLAAAYPRAVPLLNAVAGRALAGRTYTAGSADVFVARRRVRFREMEYAVPREHVPDVLRAVDRWLRTTREPVPFPLEVRFAAPDDLWLSTAHGRATGYVAVHQYHRMPHRRYFDAVERIMAEVDGRPHWGKLHSLDHVRLAALYPRLADANRVRARVDPTGTFRNDYVDRVLGPLP
ncbi:FAD-binding protein [Cellulomonas sp. zg-ZUI222]|uniref:FAD-binding protein n=1 Tax=Cellulomonas wangleii TaxID=2816956 RepID=A0ABX8D6D7_9CELL|nr:D-arabinono-1,4-lactone oxidase [Cellulomonas wangleii]MBO0921757.1 FAD-binding protein [Cellulomonas wangleii]MBO0924821.1 FAD-binding protein [Cellulomonas wangleii]QVI62989.1 FAD-binding protein [Cellulomonas wangleii]